MAHLHKKIKKGRPYYYIREMARVNGKPKVVNQVYLGSPERILEMAQGSKNSDPPTKIQVQEFGALWLANLIDQKIGLARIVDDVVPNGKSKGENGPTVGEFFLYAAFNRMVDSCSKRALSDWFKDTAIQQIRPVDINALTSQRFWDKWDRVKQDQIEEIARRFFAKVTAQEPADDNCFLFDTSNYYTYMAAETESNLAQRGKNKDGKSWLRQVGLALLVSRNNGLPLYYREYPGNDHDSKAFAQIIEQLFSRLTQLKGDQAQLTVVFDKGMNSENNISFIDGQEQIHFITAYSTYFAEELIQAQLSEFKPVNTLKNQSLRENDRFLAWRTKGDYWGKERTVVVTYNPRNARKKRYTLERKLLKLKENLRIIQKKVKNRERYWKKPVEVEKRYAKLCNKLHISNELYDLTFSLEKRGWKMSFRKNPKEIKEEMKRFGKNITITDNKALSTDEIVGAGIDRYIVENAFRQSKDDDLVSVLPVRHFTDSKIRCHILSCITALTYLRLIEIHLEKAGLKMSASTAMSHLNKLHSCLCYYPQKRKPVRIIEEPTEIQSQILKAFNHRITSSGVLQPIN